MLISKTNRFYFFVASYTSIFALLAIFGGYEAARVHNKREQVAQEAADRVASVTKNKEMYTLPRLDVTMASLQGSHHVRLGISLEIKKGDEARFADFQPKVSDRIVAFLGHKDTSDLNGPHGLTNLRSDLLFEVNKASGPIIVSDIIFREVIIR